MHKRRPGLRTQRAAKVGRLGRCRVMPQDIATTPPCCVALTQEHRGDGVSTAAYYLGRVLIAQGLRVLLVDMTGRRACLNALFAQGAVKNLVYWAPIVSN